MSNEVIVITAITAAFVIFAGTLLWADFYTRKTNR
jgi:hypothetical protein